jgi:hypothetical protein
MQLSETLMLAGIHEVERRGWTRLTLENFDGAVCAIGGLNAAAFGIPVPSPFITRYALSDSVYDLLGASLPNVNDSNRTPAPVFHAMRRLAARLSPYGKQAATTEDTATLNEWAA